MRSAVPAGTAVVRKNELFLIVDNLATVSARRRVIDISKVLEFWLEKV